MPLCDLSLSTFVQYFGGLFERAPWVLERAYIAGLTPQHDDPHLLGKALADVILNASLAEKVTLLQTHPDLLGDAPAETFSREWRMEQRRAGLHRCTELERERFRHLNKSYKDKFGYAFVMSTQGHDCKGVIARYECRLNNPPDIEFAQALQELIKIARLRMNALLLQTTAANDDRRGTGWLVTQARLVVQCLRLQKRR